MTAKIKMTSPRRRRAALKAQAMPEITRLARKFGLSVISGCVTVLREREKKGRKLKALQREIADLEKVL